MKQCRCITSTRELFFTILAVGMASVFLTYYTSHLLPRSSKQDNNVWFQGDYDEIQNINRRNLESVREMDGTNPSKNKLNMALLKTLQKIEKAQVRNITSVTILYDNSKTSMNLALLYEEAVIRTGLSAHIRIIQSSRQAADVSQRWKNTTDIERDSRSETVLYMCVPEQACARTARNHPNLMVNYIPDLGQHLINKISFCETMSKLRNIPELKSLSPVCFIMPDQAEEFYEYTKALSPDVRWIVKPIPSNSTQPDSILHITNKKQLNRFIKEPVVLQQMYEKPLLLYGMPFSVTAYVLVTSLSPLTVYMYPEGRVRYRYGSHKDFNKIPNRVRNFSQLRAYLQDRYSSDTAEAALHNMETALVKTLLSAQSLASAHSKSSSCLRCFKLLEVDFSFNSSFKPMITEISAATDPSLFPVDLLDQMLSMVLSSKSVSRDLTEAIHHMHQGVSIQQENCNWQDRQCLNQSDLQYLLFLMRQMKSNSKFKMLYPSLENQHYDDLVQEVYHTVYNADTLPAYTTTITSFMQKIIQFFHKRDIENNYEDISSFEPEKKRHENLLKNDDLNMQYFREFFRRPKCTSDDTAMPHLARIITNPNLTLTPAFDPEVYDYYATVPYECLVVTLWAFAKSCYSEARFRQKAGFNRPSNFTLGLGENQLKIMVVDISHSDPWVLSTYTVHVHREEPGNKLVNFDPGGNLKVCSLKQSCDLAFLPHKQCGLLPTRFNSWSHVQSLIESLPSCATGDEQGEWLVPCTSCSGVKNCFWSRAQWQPHTCTHRHIPHDKLKSCLSNKQVLFIGDSTNRGIMNYLVEQVNGSLTQWDKTHNIKVYNNVNEGRTTVSFAYYPQFWLPASQRPAFEKAFYQMVKRLGSLENSQDTVIVVGGVHWLGDHHLNVLRETLVREGLTDVKVIVKGLGAGFHQQVDDVHHLSLEEQKRLLYINVDLMGSAKQLGYQVVDTFNITMARYKDFLQGKCACHFHRVKEMLPSFTELQKRLSKGGTLPYKPVDIPVQYHVEGSINAVYAEILINRICQ